MAAAQAPAIVNPQPAPTADPAAPIFARIFTDHAVLQRGRPVAVWGHAAPGARVTVGIADRSAFATADAQGDWRATLPAMSAGGPYRLTASVGSVTTTLNDIAIGDVYLCSGQSNMEFPARYSTGAWGGLRDVADPDLRFVTVPRDNAPAPRADLATAVAWAPVTPDSVGEASAVCYYMARSLRGSVHVPVGFIASDWGGTTIQSWISAPALRRVGDYGRGLDLLSLYARDPAAGMAAEGRLQEAWWDAHDPHAAAERAYIAPGYDDHDWDTIVPTGSWKDSGKPAFDFNGVAWFRTTVTLTEAQARAATTLNLGPVDTYDSTWVNGVRVGGGSTAWVWREYPLSPGTLKPGRNVIAMRVLSGGGGGGLTGQPENRGIKLDTGALIPLERTWRYRTGMRATGLSVEAAPWDIPTSLSTLYNGMIAPLRGYGVKLVAWYQGEANVGKADEYRTLLPLLFADWRRTFAQPDLPFLVAQLSAFGPVAAQPVDSAWGALRDVQAKAVRADPHAGLAVTIDVGDPTNVHPTQKEVVGERLARAARVVAYGGTGLAGGPEAVAVARRGDDLVVRFRDIGGGLRTYSADVAIGFEACVETECRFVSGRVEDDTIVLAGAGTGPGGSAATQVRYAWADSPYVNLYNAENLPAVPFAMAVAR